MSVKVALRSREYLSNDYCFSCAYFRPTKGHFGICSDMGSKVPYDGTKQGSACAGWRIKSEWGKTGFKLPINPFPKRTKYVVKGAVDLRSWQGKGGLGSVMTHKEMDLIHSVYRSLAEKVTRKAAKIGTLTRKRRSTKVTKAMKVMFPHFVPLKPKITPNRIIGELSFVDNWIRTLDKDSPKTILHQVIVAYTLGYDIPEIIDMIRCNELVKPDDVSRYIESYRAYAKWCGFDYAKERSLIPFFKKLDAEGDYEWRVRNK